MSIATDNSNIVLFHHIIRQPCLRCLPPQFLRRRPPSIHHFVPALRRPVLPEKQQHHHHTAKHLPILLPRPVLRPSIRQWHPAPPRVDGTPHRHPRPRPFQRISHDRNRARHVRDHKMHPLQTLRHPCASTRPCVRSPRLRP